MSIDKWPDLKSGFVSRSVPCMEDQRTMLCADVVETAEEFGVRRGSLQAMITAANTGELDREGALSAMHALLAILGDAESAP